MTKIIHVITGRNKADMGFTSNEHAKEFLAKYGLQCEFFAPEISNHRVNVARIELVNNLKWHFLVSPFNRFWTCQLKIVDTIIHVGVYIVRHERTSKKNEGNNMALAHLGY